GLLHLEIDADVLLDDSADLVQTEAFGWVEGVTFRRLDVESAVPLAKAPWLGWLNMLDLGYNHLADGGVSFLAASRNLTTSRTLWLRSNEVGDAGAEALARSAELVHLETLSLVDNFIGDAGARALAASPHLAHLKLLNLERNPLGPSGFAALEKAAQAHPHLW